MCNPCLPSAIAYRSSARPEKLLARGAKALSDQGWLAILLGTGTTAMDVRTLAAKLAKVVDEKGFSLQADWESKDRTLFRSIHYQLSSINFLVIGLVCALVPLLVWWLKRRAARADDPAVQNEARHVQAELDVWRKDGPGASRHGLADLDELDRLRRAKGDPK